MTSRLRQKLERDNVNLDGTGINESFVLVGTPLPALSTHKKDKLEYVPEWQQTVTDEKGRRRFHGAFTGGWSAGYFNTVGSKEGWAPSTFKSSRSNRANRVQRPEDFMDEEDLAQMNDDRQLENTETFRQDGFAGTREELANRAKDLPSALESLIAPTQSSIGETLLRKMGWKPGQGIGPRVSARKMRQRRQRLGHDVTEEDDLPLDDKHSFAPKDTVLRAFDPKEDRQGLGFKRGAGMGSLPQRNGDMLSARDRPIDDDDDPYATYGADSRPYAFEGGDDDGEVINIGGPSRQRTDVPARSDMKGGEEKWHDGRPVLVGFELDPLGVPADKWFEMPEIPPDWRPRPARVWGTTRQWDQLPDATEETKEVIRGEPGRPLSFEQRGAALGEDLRISKAKSVFEYMSEKDRERISALAAIARSTSSVPAPLAMTEVPEQIAPPPPTEVIVPPTSPRTAAAALRGFLPYGEDPARQDRYTSYLHSQTYNTKTPNPTLREGTVEQINKELNDFAASARIFKPMSYAMSSRFTSGSASLAVSDMKEAKPGLHIYDAEKAKADMAKPRLAEVEVQKELTPREQAAANGMWGKMTRTVTPFYPVKLLCKRFGVPDPHPEGEPKKVASDVGPDGAFAGMPLPKNDASWEDKFIHTPLDQKPPEEVDGAREGEERKPRTIAEVGMAEDVNQGRDTLTYTKPSIDIFKAIFASDEEEDDDIEDEPEPQQASIIASRDPIGREDPYPIKQAGPMDIQSFKPVFSITSNGKSKERKDKKRKEKRKGVLSFDVGEEGEEAADRELKKSKVKDRLKRPEALAGGIEVPPTEAQQEAEGEWVEKPTVPARLPMRKGAADYM